MDADFPRTGLGEPGHPLRLAPAMAGLLAFYLVALLLNATALQSELSLLRYGKPRDIGLALIRPAAAASRVLRLERPRLWLEQHMGTHLQHEKLGF